jgi:hypothetical protein
MAFTSLLTTPANPGGRTPTASTFSVLPAIRTTPTTPTTRSRTWITTRYRTWIASFDPGLVHWAATTIFSSRKTSSRLPASSRRAKSPSVNRIIMSCPLRRELVSLSIC